MLKVAKTIEGSNENTRETKLKINALIREIDKCIIQLNHKKSSLTMAKLKVNVVIAGRTYPLSVNSTQEEEGMRKAAKNINDLISKV